MTLQKLKPIPGKEKIDVASLIQRLRSHVQLEIEVITGNSFLEEKFVTEIDLHRPGLALAGYIELFTHQRIQIIGNTETQYIKSLPDKDQFESFKKLTSFDIPLIVLTDNNTLPQKLIKRAESKKIPIVCTSLETTKFMFLLRDFLEDYFAIQAMAHGTMVDVYGIGILISGKSGIGKSEVALDLVERGHRLVSDDVVMLTKKGNVLLASATETNKHFMEIRGLGIVDVLSMFGIRSIRYQKRLEVVLELSLWGDSKDVERTGLNHQSIVILDTKIPIIHLPITPGKNITVIAEVIALNYLLKHYGYNAAEALQDKIKQHIKEKKDRFDMPGRAVEYFEGDFE